MEYSTAVKENLLRLPEISKAVDSFKNIILSPKDYSLYMWVSVAILLATIIAGIVMLFKCRFKKGGLLVVGGLLSGVLFVAGFSGLLNNVIPHTLVVMCIYYVIHQAIADNELFSEVMAIGSTVAVIFAIIMFVLYKVDVVSFFGIGEILFKSACLCFYVACTTASFLASEEEVPYTPPSRPLDEPDYYPPEFHGDVHTARQHLNTILNNPGISDREKQAAVEAHNRHYIDSVRYK